MKSDPKIDPKIHKNDPKTGQKSTKPLHESEHYEMRQLNNIHIKT